MRHRVVLLSVLAFGLLGCSPLPEVSRPVGSGPGLDRPPNLVVAAGDEQLTLRPFAYCWRAGGQGICADGVPPDPLPTLALDDDEELTVTFGLDWTLQATMVPVDGDVCDGAWTVDVAGDGCGVSTLGRVGEYRVDLFGRGEQGDAAFAFGLATTRDRPAPAPYFTAGWHPAGMELDPTARFSAYVGNLVEMPERLSAVAELTSSSGESKTFALTGEVFQDCWGSMVGFTGPEAMTAETLDLGPPPYDVQLTFQLDAEQFVAEVITWPDDWPSNSSESPNFPLPEG